MSIDSDVIRGHVDTIILKTLTTGDKYGYEIIKEIEQKSQGTYELKQPTLYSCLKRLENQGLISGFTKNSDIGGKRHYYKLTKKGRETYENSMQEWFNSRSIIDSLMGSQPTILEDKNIEDSIISEPDEEKTERNKTEDDDIEENNESSEPSQIAQMVLDDDTNICEDSEPRDFENNIDEDDAQLLGDYYKTDENQINLFGEDEPHWTEKILNSEESEVEEGFSQDETPTPSIFKNYEGADINKYKQNNKSNYYESISFGIVDDNEEDDEINYSNQFENEDVKFEDDENNEPMDEPVKKDENSPFSSFSFFTSYPEDDEEQDSAIDTFDHEESEEVENEGVCDEDEVSSGGLSFGFGYHTDSDDLDEEMNFPTQFAEMDDIKSFEDEEDDQPADYRESHISLFGEEELYQEPEQSYEASPEPEYVNYEPYEPAELKPYNIGNYTEPEYKEKLNQLSSYTKANYETKPTAYVNTDVAIESKTIAELKDEFSSEGIEIRCYSRPEKESYKEKKYLLVNKIKFVTSWIVFGIMSLLLTGSYFLALNVGYLNFKYIESALPTYAFFLIATGVTLLVPLTYTIIYLFNKTKKVKPNYSALISFVFAMLFFIVCLNIIYTLNILNGFTKFSQIDYNHLLWLLPSVVSLLIVIQSLIYSLLYKTKKFNI